MLEILFDEVQERYNVEGGNILLGGFSQGGMMTYRCGLTRPDLFAGLLILSSRLPTDAAISDNLPEDRNQPIFVAHGTSDMMISVNDARRSREFLESEGYAPEYHEYEMGHEINQAVIDDMVVWLGSVLPPGPEN
jgi:phospholipase/carboxylesterase